ncbi:RTA1 like protein-domain-containing protein [Astrocystis sublimbata]|nr:RTA1 like protein-domain-containing protein [Astrocystis sublimbata]
MTSSSTCAAAACQKDFLNQSATLPGNIVFLIFFVALFPVAAVLGARYKSLWFTAAIATGVALEAVGYVGRLLLYNMINSRAGLTIFVGGTILGPTCICGACFSILPRIVALYGEEYHGWRPLWYRVLFSVLTIAALVLQLVGSVTVTIQDIEVMVDIGTYTLIVGLAVQLIALVIFVVHSTLFALTLRTTKHALNPRFSHIYKSTLFRSSLIAFTIVILLMLVRTAYRLLQIAEGPHSFIARAEGLFLALDGATMLLATVLLLVFLPARILGEAWSETSFVRLSRQTRRLARPAPARIMMYQPGRAPDCLNMHYPMRTYSSERTNYATPISQRDSKLEQAFHIPPFFFSLQVSEV